MLYGISKQKFEKSKNVNHLRTILEYNDNDKINFWTENYSITVFINENICKNWLKYITILSLNSEGR